MATSLGHLTISLLHEEGDRGGTVHRNMYLEIQYFKCVCFGFLDTSVIAKWLRGSNP